MAVTITDHRTVHNEADATTNWTGSPTLFTADPDPVEATGCIGYVVSNATVDAYNTITSANLTNRLIYVWVFPRGAMDTYTNGGIGIHVGDGTDRMSYHVAGSDTAAFRHDTGPVGWQCAVIDQGSLPTAKTTRAGSEGALGWTAITQLGATFKTLAKSVGGVSNCFIDILRSADLSVANGCVLTITGGTSGDPGTFSEIAAADRSTSNQIAYGIVRELGVGAYGVQGPLRFGNAVGTDPSWFEDTNVSVIFESRGFRTTVYKIYVTDNGVGTTTFRLGTKVGSGATATGANGCSLIAPTGVGASFDSGTDTDVTDVKIYDSLISGFTGGVVLGGSQEFIANTVSASGAVTFTGLCTCVQTSVVGSTVAADTSALVWNQATDVDGYLDGMTFSKGTNAHHAIELGLTSPTTVNLRRMTFTGFNASNAQNDSVIHVKRTTGTVTINAIGCSGTVSYKTDGAAVTIVADPVTYTVLVTDTTGTPIQNARVYVTAAAGGPNSVGTVIISGLTDVNGEISDTRTYASDQPVTGWARKASGAPYYKEGLIAATIDSVAGASTIVQLVLDQ